MRKVGFIGFGKICKAIYQELTEKKLGTVCFVQDVKEDDIPKEATFITTYEEEAYKSVDLIIEGATADVLKENIEGILKNADLMMFSVTAFADEEFYKKALETASKYGHHIYIPHGAILGLDGILDGAKVWNEVSITTTKSPASLGREDKKVTILYDGPTRGACMEYPRNVNVHAVVALLGIGFEKTHSKIIADPSVNTNSHIISLKGQGIEMELHVTSFTTGGVTGIYTPLSAQGSLNRILGDDVLKIC